MTLTEAKELLMKNDITFEVLEFETEAEYWLHAMSFPYTKNAKSCKIMAIIIKSENEKKNIELQFNDVDGVYCFEELRFGDYCYEMFDYNEEMLADDLINNILEIMQGCLRIINLTDLTKKRWLADACFDLNDNDDVFGEVGFQKAMKRIEKPKNFLSKLKRSKKQYEIYDWNTYRCIAK